RRIRFEGDSKSPELLPAEDWSKIATIRGHPDLAAGRVVEGGNLPIAGADYREATNSGRFHASSGRLLERAVLLTSLVPSGGWSAHNGEGKPLTTVKANGVFLGLVLDAGVEDVRLDYSPPGLRTGMLISLAAVLACAAGLGVGRRHRLGKGAG